MTIPNGSDAVVDSLFSYQQYNRIKNHWYGATAPTAPVAGMIWVDSDNGKTYVYYGAAWVKIGGSMNNIWTDEDSGSHTGDTNWQVVFDESGEGRAQVLWSGSSKLTCEMRVTIDGGGAVTELPFYSGATVHQYLVFDYSVSLKLEFRVADAGETVAWKVWWNNA